LLPSVSTMCGNTLGYDVSNSYKHPQRGFLGTCSYQLRGPDEETTSEMPLTVRQQLYLLAQLAFYCGVGYKTPMGMGRVRLI